MSWFIGVSPACNDVSCPSSGNEGKVDFYYVLGGKLVFLGFILYATLNYVIMFLAVASLLISLSQLVFNLTPLPPRGGFQCPRG